MIRPVEQHERLHPKEYLDRVRKAEATPESEPRDFAYFVRETDHQKHEHPSDSDFGEDTYEASDESPDDDAASQPRPEPDQSKPPREDGSLDLTV